jgi:hypothetical protein
MSQVLKIKELMEKYKDENPLVTLRSCVAKCNHEINNCMNASKENFKESELTFWVELYDYFAEKTSNFAIYLDQFRVWQKYDENIRYCYIKDFADNYNLQISDESNKVYMRFDSDKHTLEDAIKLFKSNDGYNKD